MIRGLFPPLFLAVGTKSHHLQNPDAESIFYNYNWQRDFSLGSLRSCYPILGVNALREFIARQLCRGPGAETLKWNVEEFA